MSKILIYIICLYQKTLSPDHSPLKVFFKYPVCRYTPTCSEFAVQTLENKGLKALPLIVKRVVSCNPFSQGGYHPAPLKQKNRA